jgi:hypothetical protein
VVPDELLSVARSVRSGLQLQNDFHLPAPSIFDSAAAMRASCSLSKNETAGFGGCASLFSPREPVAAK